MADLDVDPASVDSQTPDAVPQAPGFLPVTIPTSPRDSQLYFPCPPTSPSSIISFSSTLIEEHEEDDTRALRKLLTRKITARIDAVFDEVDKILTWLRIVRDVTRSVRRMAEL